MKKQVIKKQVNKNPWLLGMAAGGMMGLGGMALSYARYVEPYWLHESYHKVELSGKDGLDSRWRGYKIVFLTDLHLSTHGEPIETLKSAVERTLALKPNLVAMGGDYFTKGVWNPAMTRLLCPLIEAGLTVVAIMGNHDYFGRRRDPDRIMDNFRRMGIKVLRNQAMPVCYKGQQGWVVGLDDHEEGEPDLSEAVEKLPEGERPLLLLAHNPEFVPDLPRDFAELTLSGHTHGGQVNPALPPLHDRFNWIRYTITSHRTSYPMGWYVVNGNKLYVSRGLGMSGFKLRFNARPELAVFEFV